MQRPADSAERPVDRTDGPSHSIRDRLDLRFLMIALLDQLSLITGKLLNAVSQLQATSLQMIADRLRLGGNRLKKFVAKREALTLTRPLFPMREHLIEYAASRPGPEICSLLKRRKMPPHYDLRLLENIICIDRVRRQRHRVAIEAALILRQQPDELLGRFVVVHLSI